MEMDAGRIFKTGFVVVLVGAISFFVYRNWDFWSGHPVDGALAMAGPYERPNPNKDPDHKILEYILADRRGKLTLTETDADGKIQSLDFKWEEALPEGARRTGWGRTVVENTLDDALASISDVTRRFWVRNILMNPNLFRPEAASGPSSYVVLAGLTPEQKETEKALRSDMVTQLTLINDGASDGSRDQTAFTKLTAALEAAKANTNKPEDDPKKADQIRAVIDLARAYEGKMDLQRIKEAQKYADSLQKLLQPDQAKHVDDFVQKQVDAFEKTGAMPDSPTALAGARRGAAGGAAGFGGAGAAGGARAGGTAPAAGGRAPRQPAPTPAQPATPATPPV